MRVRIAVGLVVLGLFVAVWRGSTAAPVDPGSALHPPSVERRSLAADPVSALPGGAERTEGVVRSSAAVPAAAPAKALAAAPAVADPEDDRPLTAEEVQAALVAGEQAMDEGELLTAIVAFTRVVEHAPDSDLAPFAAYKLAWCSWNAGDLPGARLEMERALAWLEGSHTPGADVLAVEAAANLAQFREPVPETVPEVADPDE